jgi:hypothetical protein
MSVLAKNLLTLENTTSAPRSSWSEERSALVADALRRSCRVRLRVHGESMLPALWPGDVVEMAGCSLEDVRPGEIVLARREGRLFLHRLVGRFNDPCTPNGFLLRGDSMPAPDPQFPNEALLGRMVQKIDESADEAWAAAPVGCPGFGLKWFGVKGSRALGMLFCHCGVARRLALKLHGRWKASARDLRHGEPAADMSSAEMGAR